MAAALACGRLLQRGLLIATLYVVPGSYPSMAGRLMLEPKEIAYRRVNLIPALHTPILPALRFSLDFLGMLGDALDGNNRVPEIGLDGEVR